MREWQNIIRKIREWCSVFKPAIRSSLREEFALLGLGTTNKWCKPDVAQIKFNFDGFWKNRRAGGVFRAVNGQIILAFQLKLQSCSSLETEAGALLAGLKVAPENRIKVDPVEGDSMQIIESFKQVVLLEGKTTLSENAED